MTVDSTIKGAPPSWLDNALELCGRRFGHEIPARQEGLIEEIVLRVTSDFGIRTPEECLGMLRTLPVDAPLVQALLWAFTNKESYFFRDPATVVSLRENILPELIARAQPSRTLRVWSAGCSTGEEIYTLSILLHELLPHYDDWTVSLIGTDIDISAIGRARAAVYKPWSLRVTDEQARVRYFDEIKVDQFRLKPKFRDNVSFQIHNLADPDCAPPGSGRFDLILCRNVSIYFSPRAQAEVADKFATALAQGGVWLSGPSDPTPRTGFSTRVWPGALEHRAARNAPAAQCKAPSTSGPVSSVASYGVEGRHAPAKEQDTRPLRAVVRSHQVSRAPEASLRPTRPPAQDVEEIRRLADAGRNAHALERVTKIISHYPLSAEPYLLRAMLEESASEYELACADLRRVLYITPDHIEAGLRLGLLLARRGEKAAAFAALRSVVAMKRSDDPEVEALRAVAARHLVRLIKTEPSL